MKIKYPLLISLTFCTLIVLNNELAKNKKYRFYEKASSISEPIRTILSEDDFLQDEANTPTLVINLWATWCVPCQKEIPELNQLADKYEDGDILFVSVTDEPEEKVLDWIDLQKNEPVYFQLYKQKKLINYLFSLNPSANIKNGRYPELLPTNLIIHNNQLLFFKQGFSTENILAMDSVLYTIALQNQTSSSLPESLPGDRQ